MADDEQGSSCRAFPALLGSRHDIASADHSHDVWAWNLSAETAELRDLLKSTTPQQKQGGVVVELDVVLPDSKVMCRSSTSSSVDTASAYKDLQDWLYILRPVRLTLSILHPTGGLQRRIGCWRFHMFFDLEADLHCKATVAELAASGFNFQRHATEGLSEFMFSTWLVDSGLLGQDSVEWAAPSTKLLALAYLVKFVSSDGLPEDHRDFNVILRALCPRRVSLEHLPHSRGSSSRLVRLPARSLETSRSSLQSLDGTVTSFTSSSRRFNQEAMSVELQVAAAIGCGKPSAAPRKETASTCATSPSDDTRTNFGAACVLRGRHGSCYPLTQPDTCTLRVALGRKGQGAVQDAAVNGGDEPAGPEHPQHLAEAAKASPVGIDGPGSLRQAQGVIPLTGPAPPCAAAATTAASRSNRTTRDPTEVRSGRVDANSLLEPSRTKACGATLQARSVSTEAASATQWKLHALAAMSR
eukprot:TRINITY_DN7815_c0_g3_i1.p1 TRINITY_DN7815_c0_g3~~TRINITY_DN7815_c0_g3_i1.p1  ORF type:complete len:471 (+),score=45.72 TRINITY_DN7815_c0_g3_i1:137-1549(+)